MRKIEIYPFFDPLTKVVTFVVTDPASKQAAVIDPVMGLELETGTLITDNADKIVQFLGDNNLQLEWILETDVHSNHFSAARYLKEQRGGQLGVSEHAIKMVSPMVKISDQDAELNALEDEFDYLFQDGEVFYLGHIEVEVIATPGVTPACVCYKIEDALFVGSTILMPDVGTTQINTSFGSVKSLYQSIKRVFTLPEFTRIFVGYDNKPLTRDEFGWEATVLQQKRDNIHCNDGVSEADFIRVKSQ